MENITKPNQDPNRWKNRRRLVFASLIYIAASLVYLMVFGSADNPVHNTLALSLPGAGLVIVCGYCGFATWDDHNIMKLKG